MGKGRIFLIDTMSFIFRAYHAMSRQRPMTTKSGVPTAATYVFVNMLRKLRDDFSPQYLAAVFDIGAPTIRNQQAEAITTIRKFDIKTQTFTTSGGRSKATAFQSCSSKVTKPTTLSEPWLGKRPPNPIRYLWSRATKTCCS
jgi:5'-3' exonuclease, N-terminal resolvase-like domain